MKIYISYLYYENGEIVDISHNNISLYDYFNSIKTINNDFDMSGSLINLNVGSFRSYTKLVNAYLLDTTNKYIKLS